MHTLTVYVDGGYTTTGHASEAEAFASLRENFDAEGDYADVPNGELLETIARDQGVIATVEKLTADNAAAALVEAMDFWDGFNIGIEWFVSLDGRAALGIAGAGESMQIMSLSLDDDDAVHYSSTEPGTAQFDTGGFEV